MRHLSRLLITSALLFLTGACGVLQGPVPVSSILGHKSVAIVSMLGSEFQGAYTSIRNINVAWGHDVEAWGVDEHARRMILHHLHRRANVDYTRTMRTHRRGLSEDIQALLDEAERQGIDALLVASTPANALAGGYGVIEQSFLGLAKTCIYLNYEIQYYDVQARARLGSGHAGGTHCDPEINGKLRFRPRPSEYSPEEIDDMRRTILGLIDAGASRALLTMGLAQKKTASSAPETVRD